MLDEDKIGVLANNNVYLGLHLEIAARPDGTLSWRAGTTERMRRSAMPTQIYIRVCKKQSTESQHYY